MPTGVCTYAINSRDGVRVSTNDGYLEPARGRPNLEIRGDSPVDRVLLDGRQRHRRAPAYRRRLAATFSPRRSCSRPARSTRRPILMRSGIGPAEHLRSHGIEVVKELPVGGASSTTPMSASSSS